MIVDNISRYFSHALCCCHNRKPREFIIYILYIDYLRTTELSVQECVCVCVLHRLGIQIQPYQHTEGVVHSGVEGDGVVERLGSLATKTKLFCCHIF